jgi:hypothetical protein
MVVVLAFCAAFLNLISAILKLTDEGGILKKPIERHPGSKKTVQVSTTLCLMS